MSDIVSQSKRKEMMAGIRNKNTKPEMIIRKELFARGYRYRLHCKGVPGKPDLILSKYNAVIFINGCFWHCHDCHLFKWPKTRKDFWESKIQSNKNRDQLNREILLKDGWRILNIWECALKGKTRLDRERLIIEVESWLAGCSNYSHICGTINDKDEP
ncbi:TPA: very short patch repair endonuclease [Legionella pneumophila]|uniref:very short patch repair endonuclease n=1 Tax=Legionella pneumophila TaxID=446 RepID=UPI0005B23549|nr:very short patch repair endonuclease [Legionella pneumophila]HAT9519125.1 DNA mismatch endonuclease Vsr [Legionella pneumophila subsp. pneumophila]MCK1859646.1 very short patch repair endonuclease [Legionella pneumophila]HAT2106138.1 DNA mismatch endonuclease Vsr [Legionella pneumophila]HAT9587147.1 DNA mismatch endonuclease Vsr [Legionella pneumophila subsp. pneumophila]HAT9813778.1 DNA mismatch endonuclease Vsr [Legionella pneumophila subsp. pneumophila]